MERNNLGSIFFFKDRKQLGSKVGFLKRSGHAFIWRIKVAERWLRILKMSLPRACVLLVFMMFDSITGHLSFSSVAQSCHIYVYIHTTYSHRHTQRHTEIDIHTHTHSDTYRHTGTDTHSDTHTQTHTETHRDRHAHTHTLRHVQTQTHT